MECRAGKGESSVGLIGKAREKDPGPGNNSCIVGGGGNTDPETRPRQQGQGRAGAEEEVGYQRVEGADR